METCKYCGAEGYKTNGLSEVICEKRAFNGKCTGFNPRKVIPLPGRNDLCPCGSGKKYKKCCIK